VSANLLPQYCRATVMVFCAFPGINTAGSVAGNYFDAGGVSHGYVMAADGTITSFDPPGSTDTAGAGINDNGAITGGYTGSKDAIHGYIRTQK
jgi:hypothetical protein